MRIAVNTQLLIDDKLEGLGWFTYEVLNRIANKYPEHEFIFIFNRPFNEKFIFASNVKGVVLGPRFGHPIAWALKFIVLLPILIRKLNVDLYLSPDGWSPQFCTIKKVVVIHDLNFEHHPEWLSVPFRIYYRSFFKLWAKSATRIATVSEFSKNDIVAKYSISPEKIDVVYNGVNTSFVPISLFDQSATKERFTNGEPYFIFVGATPPRKNIVNLFKAFDLFKQQNPGGHKLVLAGAKKWWASYIREEYENMAFRDDVIFTGRVSADDLNLLISSSEALVYVSLFEGFGIPLIEAMHCETAIITSNCTSMPEVAGNAALLVDPYSPQSISDAMFRICNEKTLRNELIERGRIRRTIFSWDTSADLLWKCIEKSF